MEFGWWPWCYEAARSANTPADRSKRAAQLSPGAALPALCLLGSGRIVIPYTECVVWCTAIKIMMITARKRGLILAVGGGFDVAARKRGLNLAVGGGFDVAARKRGLIWPLEEDLLWRPRKGVPFGNLVVYTKGAIVCAGW